MRLTEKNTPILKYLSWDKPLTLHKDFGTDKFNILGITPTDMQKHGFDSIHNKIKPFVEDWPTYQNWFSKNIDVVSLEFMTAAFANFKKIISEETLRTLFGKQYSGTLICGDLALCYCISWLEEEDYRACYLVHSKGGLVYSLDGDNEFVATTREDLTKMFADSSMTYIDYMRTIPILFILFKRFAEVETVDAMPFKKVKTPDKKDNLLVDFNLNVKYTDCSWFRTIVRKEGFLVRGHFRLQRYKDEKRDWDYKLIYIEPYQKHGYTRTAKKTVEERKNGII